MTWPRDSFWKGAQHLMARTAKSWTVNLSKGTPGSLLPGKHEKLKRSKRSRRSIASHSLNYKKNLKDRLDQIQEQRAATEGTHYSSQQSILRRMNLVVSSFAISSASHRRNRRSCDVNSRRRSRDWEQSNSPRRTSSRRSRKSRSPGSPESGWSEWTWLAISQRFEFHMSSLKGSP